MRNIYIYIISIILLILLQNGCIVTATRYRKDTERLENITAKKIEEYKKLTNEYETLVKEKEKLEEDNNLLRLALDAKEDTKDEIITDLKKENDLLKDKNKQLFSENEDLKEKIVKLAQKKKTEIEALKDTYNTLVDNMQKELKEGEVKITQLENKVSVTIVDKILFESGEVQIKQTGRKLLKRVGEILKNVKDQQIKIEGHTDNVPIGKDLKSKYPTNWELSAARAINVARYLKDETGIDPVMLFVSAYAQYRPVADNRTEGGRAQNRRIEIVLVPWDVEQVPVTEQNK